MGEEKLKILVVEDDSVDRELIRRTLDGTSLTVSVEEIETAGKALEELKKTTYDIVLLDYRLPDNNALAVLKSLKNGTTVPIIILTGNVEKKSALEAIREGAQDFLAKDQLSSETLERSIRYSIERSQLLAELQISREREQRERELRAFQESVTEFDTAPPPAMKESTFSFDQFVDEYSEILSKAMEEMAFKTTHQVPGRLRILAEQLGELHAGPKDVIDIHSSAVRQLSKKMTKVKERALNDEGRVMLVHLMGYLSLYYRNRLLNFTADSLLPKKKPQE
ncbi:MAG TPA: response regulator [Oculatellaceae cyanobacterium]